MPCVLNRFCFAKNTPAIRAAPMVNCMTRLKSAANGAPVPRKPFAGKRDIAKVARSCLVARKLFCPNVVFIHSGIDEHSARRCNHSRRPGNVKDWTGQLAYVFGKYFRSNMANFTLPSPGSTVDARERWDEMKVCNRALQVPESIHKRRVFEIPVRIKKKDIGPGLVHCSRAEHAQKRGDSNSSGQKNGWL